MAGYATLIIEQSDQVAAAPLSAADCAGLRDIPGVGPVVSIQPPVSVPAWSDHGPDVTVVPVGGEVVAFLHRVAPGDAVSRRTAQAFVDRDSAVASPASREYPLPLFPNGNGVEGTAIAMELDAFGSATSGAMLVADIHSGPVEACALFVPGDLRAGISQSIKIAFPAVSGFSQRWALPEADRLETPRQRFEGRWTKDLWLPFAGVFTAFWLFYLRLRKPEHGLYAIVGLGPAAVTLLSVVELLIIALGASLLAGVVVGLAALRAETGMEFLVLGVESGIRTLVGCVLLSVVWSAHMATRTTTSIMDALKDR